MKDHHSSNARGLTVVLLLVEACLLCVLAVPVLRHASAQGQKFNGSIAFVSNRNGPPGEIYLMNPDGSDHRNITNTPDSETGPAFSPDGKKVAFSCDGLCLTNPDGSGRIQILDSASAGLRYVAVPDWSPDSKKIAFMAAVGNMSWDIFVINADGTGLAQLTTDPADDSTPRWAPDGKKLAFATIRDRVPNEVNFEIYVMNADGSNQTRLTNNTKFDHSPAYSPDGTRITFTSRRDDNFEIYLMNADGSNQTRLTDNGEQDSDAEWSPDGTRIAFTTSRDGRWGEIYTMNPDGTGLVNLTNTPHIFEMDPSWQQSSVPFIPPSPTPTPSPTATPRPSPGWTNTWEPFTPSPLQVTIDVSTCGSRTFAKLNFDFNDLGYRVADWGSVERTNNDFSTDTKPERWTGGSGQALMSVEMVKDLGELAPGSYTFTVKSRGLVLKSQVFHVGGVSAVHAADDAAIFVWRHYLDFLGREPDAHGFTFWTRNMTSCGADAACAARKRVDTSAAFFLSIEFQRTGFLVYRLYRASYGRMPRREEFLPDARAVSRAVVVNAPGWESQLVFNTRAFVDSWVNRPDFKFNFDQLTDAQFVDRLAQHAGINLAPERRDALIADLAAHTLTRAGVLRALVEDQTFTQKEFSPAFVLMQYFGYLERNPDEGRDTDMTGFNFWLKKLNEFGGDYVKADMVKAFITSGEYRARFCSQ